MKNVLLKLHVVALVAIVCFIPNTTFAGDKKIVKQILSNGGVKGNNSTFTQVGTFGETFVGVRESSTYTVAQGFWNPNGSAASCCVGLVGNVDCDPNDYVDIIDLTVLIDYLFVSFSPLCCEAEGNFGPAASGPGTSTTRPDIAALTAMIDYLFITFEALPSCPN